MTEIPNDLAKLNRDALRAIAKDLDIPGRGNMLKPELVAAIIEARKVDALVNEIVQDVTLTGRRVDVYRRQNGSNRLTPRQVRRIKHKANRALSQGRAS